MPIRLCSSDRLVYSYARQPGSMLTHDEPGAPLPGHIGPSPLQENTQAETGCGNVNRGSNEPRSESANLNLAALQHRKTLAYNCHTALVEMRNGARIHGFAGI